MYNENDTLPVPVSSDGADAQADGPAETAKPSAKKKKHTAKSYAFSLLAKLGITVLVVFIALKFVCGVHICHTMSAYPNVRDGEFCLTYRLAEPKKGTMIVYRHNGEVRFGRVIASGGDKVEIFSDFVTVNGFGITEQTPYNTSSEGSAISYPYYVPDNCVFILNDYRSDLSDSRTLGGIPTADIEGAVVFTMRMRGI